MIVTPRVHPGGEQPVLEALAAQGFELITNDEWPTRARKSKLVALSAELSVIEASVDVPPARRKNVRGTRFEKWLGDFFGAFGFKPNLNVVNPGEQIDFTDWLQNIFVIGEARWRAEPVGEDQVRDLFGKLAERPPFAIGLIISMSGFTDEALQYIQRMSGQRTMLTLDRSQLEQILAGAVALYDWLASALRERLEHPARRAPRSSANKKPRSGRVRGAV
jgi:hypothetical protein